MYRAGFAKKGPVADARRREVNSGYPIDTLGISDFLETISKTTIDSAFG
jgi:hypothetical protein